MAIAIRPADLQADSGELVETLQRNLPHLPHALLFPWLYLRNPQGQAKAWLAIDSNTDRVAGVAAAFPRRIYYRGVEMGGYLLGDFCIDSSHRSLGAAIAMQRACLEGLSGADFIFDFPSQTMLAVYKRLGINVGGSMTRYAKPLRADRQIAERVPISAVAHALSAVANAGLRLRDHGRSQAPDCKIAAEPGPWNEEYTAATKRWSACMGRCVARTADYLNWRYGEHPRQEYHMLTARRDGVLAGYLVYHAHEDACTIDDLMGDNDSVLKALLNGATASARSKSAVTLSVPWLSSHPGTRFLEKCGFHPRESSPVALLGRQSGDKAAAQWHLTHGDWES